MRFSVSRIVRLDNIRFKDIVCLCVCVIIVKMMLRSLGSFNLVTSEETNMLATMSKLVALAESEKSARRLNLINSNFLITF